MTPNEKFISDLTTSLTDVFSIEAKKIAIASEDRLEKHKHSINRNMRWVVGIIALVLISLFSGLYGMIRAGDNKQIQTNKDVRELQTDLGLVDGVCSDKFPESTALGIAYDKYIKRRGGAQ